MDCFIVHLLMKNTNLPFYSNQQLTTLKGIYLYGIQQFMTFKRIYVILL